MRRATAARRRLLFCQNLGGRAPTLPTHFLHPWTSSFPKIFFASSLCRNEELPRDFRLKENSFQMTTFIFDDIAAKTESRLNLVRIKAESVIEFLRSSFSELNFGSCPIFNMWLISSWEENKCCYKLSNWQNDNYFHSKRTKTIRLEVP